MLNGLKSGLKMIAQALSMRHRALSQGNAACVHALDGVFSIWFTEVTGAVMGTEKIDVKIGLFALLMGDPFAGSRLAFRAVMEEFSGV